MHPDPIRTPVLNESHLDVLEPNLVKGLRAPIREFNDRSTTLKPDFYGTLAYNKDYYDKQDATLVDLRTKLDAVLEGGPDEYTRGELTKLQAEVGRAVDWMLNDRLVHQLPGGTVPTILHTFWSGKAIREDALRNILRWGQWATGTGWTVRVWTDSTNSDWPAKTMERLRKVGVEVVPLSKANIHAKLWEYYDVLVHGEKPNYPAASDLARYSFLNLQGGVYVDVDIAPGTVTPSQLQTYVRLPLLAPELRDLNSALGALGLPPTVKKINATQLARAAALRLEAGMYNGNFIAVTAKSPAIQATIDFVTGKLAEHAKKMGKNGLLEMPSDAAFVTGPAPLKQALIGFLESACDVSTARAASALNQAMLHDLPLGWITGESENQEH